MKQFKIIVRKNIFSSLGILLSDDGLKAIDGYWEFLVKARSEEESLHRVLARTIPCFEQQYPAPFDVRYEAIAV